MKRQDIRVAVMRIEGTNNEDEMWRAFHELGANAELVHLNQLVRKDIEPEERRKLSDFHVLMFPGGFSAGDYIRAGAIFAARMKAALKDDLEEFVRADKPVGGHCNGFQILVELGLLPGASGLIPGQPMAVLNRNDSARFECRPTVLRHESRGKCVWTREIPRGKLLTVPSAHGEGKLMFPQGEQAQTFQRLLDEDRIVFSYATPEGQIAPYPWNPNGSSYGVAGICNETGTVYGMMPHPERVFWRYQHPDWTRTGHAPDGPGDGRAVFESVLKYVEKRF
ncbi:MAG TPA: phosphoribosylformylglycinamidine synthase subunit PurQ [Candidatus Thermoplasmatota archaeon]|nr:phosphoribosylformylglycinamidine synthase subunit PurQ [Candidatus Thermoplasmatota archaeon]